MYIIEEINLSSNEENKKIYAETMKEAEEIICKRRTEKSKRDFCDYLIYKKIGYIPETIILSEFSKNMHIMGILTAKICKLTKKLPKPKEHLKNYFEGTAKKLSELEK